MKEHKNISICTLVDSSEKVNKIFEVESDWDPDFHVLYFTMYDAKDKNKKRASDIIVDYDPNGEQIVGNQRQHLEDLIKFLTNWDFKTAENFYLSCKCRADLMSFLKLKKDFFNDDNDNMYVDYYYSGIGKMHRKQVIEVNLSKEQAIFLGKEIKKYLIEYDSRRSIND